MVIISSNGSRDMKGPIIVNTLALSHGILGEHVANDA